MEEMKEILKMKNHDRQSVLIAAMLTDARESIACKLPYLPLAVLSSPRGFMLVRGCSELVNDPEMRTEFFAFIREKANEVEADIVIFGIDVYEHIQTPEQVEEEKMYIEINNGERLPIEMRQVLNLSETKEGIMILVETAHRSYRIMQYYKTLENGDVQFGDEETFEMGPKMEIFPCKVKSHESVN